MQTIKHELSVGKANKNLDLFVTLAIEGQPKERFKCESFLAPFAGGIYDMLSKHPHAYGVTGFDFAFGEHRVSDDSVAGVDDLVYSMDNIGGAVDRHRALYEDSFDNGTTFQLLLSTNWEHIDGGLYTASVVDFTEYSGDPRGRVYIRLHGVPPSDKTSIHDNGEAYVVADFTITSSPIDVLTPYIGTFNGAVKPSLVDTAARITDLPESVTSASPVVTDQQSSVITISRSFTNDTGADINITEIGLLDGVNAMARDVLASARVLADTKTVTIDYEVRADIDNFNQDTAANGTNGGFTAEFIQALRKRAFDYDAGDEWQLFCFFGGGSDTSPVLAENGLLGKDFGITLGRNNKFVSMTDTQLNPDNTAGQEPVAHGEADGQLFYKAMEITPISVDDAAGEVRFTVSREFENKGSTPVEVREHGLYANRTALSRFQDIRFLDDIVPTLIARTALDDTDKFTVAAGARARVEYDIVFIV